MQRKQFLRLLGASLGMTAMAPLITACGGGEDDALAAVERADTDSELDEALSPEEIAGLMYMREEEKLAHDVYVALFNIWGAQVFAQIAESETEHTEAVRQLIEAHGLEDPAANNPPGVFVDTDLQAMYDALVARGQTSLIEAIRVGCLIEEKDIQDINDKKAEVMDEPDIVQVYDHLLCGSRNHLRAFNDSLLQQGLTYEATVLSQAEWDAIAYSSMELCGG